MFSRLFKNNSVKINSFKKYGKNVTINSEVTFQCLENIEIGDDVYIGPHSMYVGHGGLKIGNGSILAHNVEIQTRNHNFDGINLVSIPYDKVYVLKPVVIGENVWVGSHAKVIPGVSIGEWAVVGMGAVVTKDVPPFAVVDGNPAKVIKYRDKEKYYELKDKVMIYMKLKNK